MFPGVLAERIIHMSIKNKIIVPSIFINILICVVVAILFCGVMKKELISVGAQDALYVANKAGAEIDGSIVEKLKVGGEDSAVYRRIFATLENVQAGASVAAMHTLYTDGKVIYYGVSTSLNTPMIGELYEESLADLSLVFEGNQFAGDYIRTTQDGSVITSYIPIENKTGDIVGLIACDYNAGSIIAALTQTIFKTAILGGICIFCSIILITMIAKKVIKNLNVIDKKICDIVNDHGDLTQTIESNAKDETGRIAKNVNELLRYIREIMSHIALNSEELNFSSENVANNLKCARAQLNDVADIIQQMSATMEETSASISGIDELTQQINDAICQISDSSEDGALLTAQIQQTANTVKQEAIEEQNNVMVCFEQMSRVVGEKIKQSKTVENISSLTDEIIAMTRQTNLLSLNASIEAARAGEVGRGFAVVASEIGKLASESANAASKIEEVSHNVIMAVEELAQESQKMIVFMNQITTNCYEKLVNMGKDYSHDSTKINEMMRQFQIQAKQLHENMDNISHSITEVNSAVEENTKGIYGVSGMSAAISENVSDIEEQADTSFVISKKLRTEVNKFKI